MYSIQNPSFPKRIALTWLPVSKFKPDPVVSAPKEQCSVVFGAVRNFLIIVMDSDHRLKNFYPLFRLRPYFTKDCKMPTPQQAENSVFLAQLYCLVGLVKFIRLRLNLPLGLGKVILRTKYFVCSKTTSEGLFLVPAKNLFFVGFFLDTFVSPRYSC